MIRPTQLRFAWRMLRKNPATSLLAVVALALGIGLTTSMFSLVHGVLLSRVPFEDPHRLMDVAAYNLDESLRDLQLPMSPVHDFLDWQEQQTSFEDLAASSSQTVNLNDEAGYPERFQAGFITWNTLGLLGVEPVIGRAFTAEDDAPGASGVILLGHDMWRHRFAGDPGVVGQTIRINGEPTTVIGVMPDFFEFPLMNDCWLPARLDVADKPRGTGGSVWVVGRLRDGVRRSEAQAEMTTIAARLAEIHPDTNGGRGAVVRDYRESLNNQTNRVLLSVMFAAVFLVLVIACANVASLLLARASIRARELAIRTALGAHRARVIGILVAESLLLSLLGSAGGLGLAHLGTRWMENAFNWQPMPYWITLEMQPVAVAFVVVAGILAGLFAGLLPALRASGAVSFDLLKDEGRGGSGMRIGRLSRALVVTELALACALLVATSLMVRTVVNYHDADLAFETDSILTARLSLNKTDYPQKAGAVAFYERLVDELASRPEVESAAVMSGPPAAMMGSSFYGLEGESYANQSEYPSSPRGVVTPDFFETYGIPVLEGRLFDRQDTAESPGVVIVNQSFAAVHWPGQSALGKRLKLGRGAGSSQGERDEDWRSVVGVVPDASISLLNPAFAGTTEAGFYVPHSQLPLRTMSVAVKTRGNPAAFATPLRETLSRLDAALALDEVRTMERIIWENTFSIKVIMISFSFFGATALLLVSVGIFGVMMFSVSQQTREFGVRMALGARPQDVLGLVLKQGLGRITVGLGLGLGLAWGLGSALRMALFGVEPLDPLSFGGTVVVLAGVALVACYVPAWRAARLDPLVVLRYE